MSFPSKPTANKLTKSKLTVETMEPMVLLSASHFGFDFHNLDDFQNHFTKEAHSAWAAYSHSGGFSDHKSHDSNFQFGNHSSHRGSPGDNVLVGSAYNDLLYGRGGDDLILGRAGKDSISGGSGDDLIRGGSGNDVLKAGSGSDLLKGGSGKDTLIGGTGSETLKGEAGDDVIIDGSGSDLIDGGSGNDLLVVDRPLSDYTIRDLANNDFEIESSTGTDVVTAVERIRFADGEYVVSDLLQQISQATGVVTPPVPANPITPDSVAGKMIHGSAGSDQIKGTIGDDLVKGGKGDDAIQGDLGDDILKGGIGNDVLNGGEGDDHLLGGIGDDTLIVGNGNDVVDGGAGHDTAVFNTVFDVVDIGNGTVRVQSIEGTDIITNVEQLSIDGTLISLDQALLFHGLPPATDSSTQPVDSAVADTASSEAQPIPSTTEIELMVSSTQKPTVKRAT